MKSGDEACAPRERKPLGWETGTTVRFRDGFPSKRYPAVVGRPEPRRTANAGTNSSGWIWVICGHFRIVEVLEPFGGCGFAVRRGCSICVRLRDLKFFVRVARHLGKPDSRSMPNRFEYSALASLRPCDIAFHSFSFSARRRRHHEVARDVVDGRSPIDIITVPSGSCWGVVQWQDMRLWTVVSGFESLHPSQSNSRIRPADRRASL